MPAPISVIIPTLNAAERIGPTLDSLSEGLGAGLIAELILSDGGSQDEIGDIADTVGARLMTGPPGRGGQLARAAAEARGAWLFFLHADSQPAPGWTAPVAAHLSAHRGKAGYFDLEFDATGAMPRITAAWANARSRWFARPFGDQGLVIPAGLYARLGGHPDQPLMEDVALARRLGAGRLAPLGHPILTSAARYRRDRWLLRGAGNLRLQLEYALGRDPEVLARRYRA